MLLDILSNTGNVSLMLYVLFILIAFSSCIYLYRLLKKGTIEPEKLDKLIDFFKTVVLTTALGTVALIVTDLFKEREQELKELEYFDKYTNEVKDVDWTSRRQLAKYFAIVAPEGNMRKAWIAYDRYEDSTYKILSDSIAHRKLDSTTQALKMTNSSQPPPTLAQIKTDMSIQAASAPLSSINTIIPEEWIIIAGGDNTRHAAQDELNKALKINLNSAIIFKQNSYRTVLLGYMSYDDAVSALQDVKTKIRSGAYIVNKKSWCANMIITDSCNICK